MGRKEYIQLLSNRLEHIQNLQSSFTGVFIALLTAVLGILCKSADGGAKGPITAIQSLAPYAEGIYVLCMIVLFWAFLFALYQAFASVKIINLLRLLDPALPGLPWYFNGTNSRIWLYGITHSFPAILSAVIPMIYAYYWQEKRMVTIIGEVVIIPVSLAIFYYAFREKLAFFPASTSNENGTDILNSVGKGARLPRLRDVVQ
ncbi:MAG: hypothetical protein HGB01_00730 [Chlorobiaceae bacterium]|nr:hypothetical protein [Chlorobiaceae bacterium]